MNANPLMRPRVPVGRVVIGKSLPCRGRSHLSRSASRVRNHARASDVVNTVPAQTIDPGTEKLF